MQGVHNEIKIDKSTQFHQLRQSYLRDVEISLTHLSSILFFLDLESSKV